MATVGRKTATKEQMIEWASALYPNLPWIRARGKVDGAIVAANEHLADALGVAHAGIKTPEFRSAAAMMSTFSKTNKT